MSNESTWAIYWWARVGGPKIYGKDIVTIKGDELTLYQADDILSRHADTSDRKHVSDMPKFDAVYPNADFCENFGVVRIKKVNKK